MQEQSVNDQPQSSVSSPRKKRKFFKLLLLMFLLMIALGVCFLLGGITYWYFTKDKKEVAETTQEDDEANQDDTSVTVEKPVLEKDLQEIINEDCVKVTGAASYSYHILSEKFPFTIKNFSPIKVPGTEYDAVCVTDEEVLKNKGSIFMEIKDAQDNQSSIAIHDDRSIELGHGGAPYLGEYGEVFDSGSDYEMSVYLVGSDTPTGSVSEYFVYVRARKILEFRDGEKIYLNMDISFSSDEVDEYLVAHSTQGTVGLILDYDEAKEGLVEEFFSDVNNLDGKAKEVYDQAMAFIEAIDYKD